MDVECRGDVAIDGIEKRAELRGAMAAVTFADHLAGLHIQRANNEVVPWRS